jgi:hypothetical protein
MLRAPTCVYKLIWRPSSWRRCARNKTILNAKTVFIPLLLRTRTSQSLQYWNTAEKTSLSMLICCCLSSYCMEKFRIFYWAAFLTSFRNMFAEIKRYMLCADAGNPWCWSVVFTCTATDRPAARWNPVRSEPQQVMMSLTKLTVLIYMILRTSLSTKWQSFSIAVLCACLACPFLVHRHFMHFTAVS